MLANMFGPKRIQNLPDDLRQSVGEDALARLAVDAAQVVGLQNSRLAVGPASAQSDPQRLLAILTYSYAAGIYASQAIEWSCHHDPIVRTLCGGPPPDWSAVWRFRNANRPWVEECLARLYDAACRGVPAGKQPSFGAGPISEVAPSSELIEFARQKVRRASRTDSALYE